MIKELLKLVNEHFDVSILVFLFIFSAVMLAAFPTQEELGRFIENGALPVGIISYITGRRVGQLASTLADKTSTTTMTADTTGKVTIDTAATVKNDPVVSADKKNPDNEEKP